MNDKNSVCEKDAYKNHCWVFLGIVPYKNKIYKIFECSQCEEAIWNEVNFEYKAKVICKHYTVNSKEGVKLLRTIRDKEDEI
jgi:hypothetical protein